MGSNLCCGEREKTKHKEADIIDIEPSLFEIRNSYCKPPVYSSENILPASSIPELELD